MIIIPVYKSPKVDPFLQKALGKYIEKLIVTQNKNLLYKQAETGRLQLENNNSLNESPMGGFGLGFGGQPTDPGRDVANSIIRGQVSTASTTARLSGKLIGKAQSPNMANQNKFSFNKTEYNSLDEPTVVDINHQTKGAISVQLKSVIINSNINEFIDLFQRDLRKPMSDKVSTFLSQVEKKIRFTIAPDTLTPQKKQIISPQLSAVIFDSTDLDPSINYEQLTIDDITKLTQLGWKYVFVTDYVNNKIWQSIAYAKGKQYSMTITIDSLMKFYKYRVKAEEKLEDIEREIKQLMKR